MPARSGLQQVFVSVVIWAALEAASLSAQKSDPQDAQKFRLLRSTSGSVGREMGGRYVIEDPRTTFHIAEDKQVIVFFEWQGPPGMHHIECSWRSPEGKVVSNAVLDQEAAQSRFGAFWTMPLSDKTMPGLWAAEATVNGVSAGVHTIQVMSGAGALATPTRRLLSPGEIYKRASASTVLVEKQDASGNTVSKGSGFFLGEGAVVTAFQVIDGATTLTLALSDGRRLAASHVIAWNRGQDWVLLKTVPGHQSLERAPDHSWTVGDRCFSLEPSVEGSRILVDLSIAGQAEPPGAGERLILSGQLSGLATGSPLLNEYGEAIGIAGVSLLAGADSRDLSRPVGSGLRQVDHALLATPTDLLPREATYGAPVSLGELASSGQFQPLLTASRHIFQASFGRKVNTRGSMPSLVDQGSQFSRRDGQIILWVMWEPKVRLKTTFLFRVYDLSNRLLGETKPGKVDLPPGPYSYTYWPLDISKFPPGVYRVDIVVGTEAGWRGYLKITD